MESLRDVWPICGPCTIEGKSLGLQADIGFGAGKGMIYLGLGGLLDLEYFGHYACDV